MLLITPVFTLQMDVKMADVKRVYRRHFRHAQSVNDTLYVTDCSHFPVVTVIIFINSVIMLQPPCQRAYITLPSLKHKVNQDFRLILVFSIIISSFPLCRKTILYLTQEIQQYLYGRYKTTAIKKLMCPFTPSILLLQQLINDWSCSLVYCVSLSCKMYFNAVDHLPLSDLLQLPVVGQLNLS